MKVDSVLTPAKHAELADVASRLAKFNPTKIAVEALSDRSNFVTKSSRNSPDYFPFDKVDAYAKAHEQGAALDRIQEKVGQMMKQMEAAQKTKPIRVMLADVNEPARVLSDHQNFYYALLPLANEKENPEQNRMRPGISATPKSSPSLPRSCSPVTGFWSSSAQATPLAPALCSKHARFSADRALRLSAVIKNRLC